MLWRENDADERAIWDSGRGRESFGDLKICFAVLSFC